MLLCYDAAQYECKSKLLSTVETTSIDDVRLITELKNDEICVHKLVYATVHFLRLICKN